MEAHLAQGFYGQLLAEIEEAKGQIETALRYINEQRANSWMFQQAKTYDPPVGYSPRDRWLAHHKLREAIRNLEDVAEGIKP